MTAYEITVVDESWGEGKVLVCSLQLPRTLADAKAFVCVVVDHAVERLFEAGVSPIFPDFEKLDDTPSYLAVTTVIEDTQTFAVAIEYRFRDDEMHYARLVRAEKVA